MRKVLFPTTLLFFLFVGCTSVCPDYQQPELPEADFSDLLEKNCPAMFSREFFDALNSDLLRSVVDHIREIGILDLTFLRQFGWLIAFQVIVVIISVLFIRKRKPAEEAATNSGTCFRSGHGPSASSSPLCCPFLLFNFFLRHGSSSPGSWSVSPRYGL